MTDCVLTRASANCASASRRTSCSWPGSYIFTPCGSVMICAGVSRETQCCSPGVKRRACNVSTTTNTPNKLPRLLLIMHAALQRCKPVAQHTNKPLWCAPCPGRRLAQRRAPYVTGTGLLFVERHTPRGPVRPCFAAPNKHVLVPCVCACTSLN